MQLHTWNLDLVPPGEQVSALESLRDGVPELRVGVGQELGEDEPVQCASDTLSLLIRDFFGIKRPEIEIHCNAMLSKTDLDCKVFGLF